MDFQSVGRALISIGVVLVLVGALFALGQRFHFGHLPGDIVVRRGHTTIYVPITTMVIASVVLTIVVNLISRIFHR